MIGLILIFIAKVAEVALTTLRLVFINKGEKLLASIIGLVEVTLWLKIASVVLENISEQPAKMIVYALGFACGNYLGLLIEDKLGLGYSNIQIITDLNDGSKLADKLRSLGKAVTITQAEGRDSHKLILSTYVKRKDKDEVLTNIKQLNINGVVTISEIQKVYGGFGIK